MSTFVTLIALICSFYSTLLDFLANGDFILYSILRQAIPSIGEHE